MKAVILVGGFGTRLRPLTLTTPKHLLPLGDRRLLDWVVGHVAVHGVTEVVLALGYRPDAYAAAYPDGHIGGIPLRYVVEPEPLGTAGALRFAADEVGLDDTFLVMNGDVLSDIDVTALVAYHRACGGSGTIALHRVEDPSAFGVVPTDQDGRVLAFVEKPPVGEAPTDLINAGVYVLEPDVVKRIPAGEMVSIERQTFPEIVVDGDLYALPGRGYWLDTGTPAQYLQANLDLIDGRRAVSSAAVLGDVDAAATVHRSVIGERAVVSAGALVTDSVVMPGARIEAGASVTRSIVGRDAVVGAGAHVVGLSVIGDGIVVEPDSRLVGRRVPDPDDG